MAAGFVPHFARQFKIWEYWVSHSRLLLRSPGDLRHPAGSSESRNIDISFVGVLYIDLPAVIQNLEIVEAIEEDRQRAERALGGPLPYGHLFVIVTGDRRYMVVALNMFVSENDLPLMQTAVERP